jgi:hypothetical protein
MSVGGHGEVLVSQSLRDIVAGSSLRFEDHGVHTLKGIEGDWHLFLVTEVDGERVAEPLDGAEAARRRMAIEPAAPPRTRRLAVVALAALVAVPITVAGVLLFGPGSDEATDAPTGASLLPVGEGPAPGSIASLDARTGEIVVDRADVPGTTVSTVHDIEVGYGSVWDTRIPIVVKIDPEDGSSVPVRGIEGDISSAIGVGLGRIWLVGSLLYPVDPATGVAGDGLPYLDVQPTFLAAQDVATGFDAVWIASNDGSVERVDPDTGAAARIELGDTPERIAAGADSIWVLDPGAGQVWRLDPDTERAQGIQVSGRLDELAIGGGFVWVLDTHLGTLTPIAETDGTVRQPVAVGEDASDVAFGLGSVWVSSGGDVLEIDTNTARIEETFHVGDTPIAGLAVDEPNSAIWLDLSPTG